MTDSDGTDPERRLADLVAYYVGLFPEAVSRIDADPAWIAHALWMLAREAEKQREQWIAFANESR